MQLSKLEDMVFEVLKSNNLSVFRVRDISVLLGFDRVKSYNIVKALKKKGAIESLQAGVYTIRGTNEFVVGALLNWPSYLSFWSALNYYGFSDQTPRTIFFVSTKYKKRIKNFRYVTLSRNRFFGYTSVGDITIAEKEKAIVDSLLLPKYAGGMREVFTAVRVSLKEIDLEKLVKYALKMKSRAVVRRLGFVLGECGVREKALEKLLKNRGRGFELLDPSLKRKCKFNKTWLLDINW